MEIRCLSQSDDRMEISRIYEESWKFAYRDMIPQSYLDSIPAGQWAANLDRDEMYTLVMLENGNYIGTSSYCKSRSSDFEGYGEIVSIYLLPEYIGKGYGKQLLAAAVAQLSNMGFDHIFLWVLEDNIRARKFYEKEGFVLSNNFLIDNIGGRQLREIQYCYRAV